MTPAAAASSGQCGERSVNAGQPQNPPSARAASQASQAAWIA
ncbi:Uncharacterised protein [Bordetella pertussis]|nr:Uncharacterised protein [Bordetella pertussis]CFP56134.1 Uncharacterised protein [Bordetella pertussis]CPJ39298.1 Uncharacterised protein [Bordetella pertussis]CPR05990.1 Uncharacterised protein [Bordetella pertussis]